MGDKINMFEKEAKEYSICQTYPKFENEHIANFVLREVEGAYWKGANDVYHKYNEWHFVKDNDLPKCDENTKLWLYFKDYCANDRDCEHPIYRTAKGVYRKAFLNEDMKIFVEESRGYSSEILLKDMIAWQYLPTPPKEK